MRQTNVLLDGVVQTNLRAWDCDQGFIVRLATEPDGRLRIEAGDLVEETLHGSVTVELKGTSDGRPD